MKKINYEIKVRCWKDKLTGSWLIYSKKFSISAYGETKAKARNMFNVIISECLINAVSGSLFCHLKETADNEVTLVRESETGLKYLIATDDSMSYGRVGKNISESECKHFDGTNGKKILQEWAK